RAGAGDDLGLRRGELLPAELRLARHDVAEDGARDRAGSERVREDGADGAAVLRALAEVRPRGTGVEAVGVRAVAVVAHGLAALEQLGQVAVGRPQHGAGLHAEHAQHARGRPAVDRPLVGVVEDVDGADRDARRAADALPGLDHLLSEEVDGAEAAAVELAPPGVGPLVRLGALVEEAVVAVADAPRLRVEGAHLSAPLMTGLSRLPARRESVIRRTERAGRPPDRRAAAASSPQRGSGASPMTAPPRAPDDAGNDERRRA